jgi:hypothetical protein
MTMSSINPVGTNYSYQQLQSTPPPEQSGWSKFGSVLSSVGSNLPVVGSALSGMGVDTGMDRQMQLMQLQMQMQMQSQQINMLSNISKTKHEASMAAIRNMK